MAANALDDIVKRLTTPEVGKFHGGFPVTFGLCRHASLMCAY
jgi:hypothetical protein